MRQLIIAALLAVLPFTQLWADAAETAGMADMDPAMLKQMVAMGVKKVQIDEGVSIQDAIDSMKLRANNLNFKLVADLPLSEQIKAMGEDSRHMQILAFCDALIAKKMVEYDMIFASFLPCRIAVLEDADGNGWIVTQNMDMMLHAVDLPPELQPLAKQVRDTIYSIVDAGATGDL